MAISEPYGKIDITGSFSLPKETALAEAAEEKKLPWKWIVLAGLGFLLIWSLIGKEEEKK